MTGTMYYDSDINQQRIDWNMTNGGNLKEFIFYNDVRYPNLLNETNYFQNARYLVCDKNPPTCEGQIWKLAQLQLFPLPQDSTDVIPDEECSGEGYQRVGYDDNSIQYLFMTSDNLPCKAILGNSHH